VGFWKAVQDARVGDLLWPEAVIALLLGIGGSIWLTTVTAVSDRVTVVADYLFIVGPLVGVVIAGLALVITLLSAGYLRTLRGDKPLGVLPFVQPFMIVIGIQTATLLGCVAYRAAAEHVPVRAEQMAFCVVTFFFALSALDVIAIGRSLVAHAVTRSTEAAVEEREEEQRVRRLRS
jgi:hypothetical protein